MVSPVTVQNPPASTSTSTLDSTLRLAQFLEENRLHKKDFADMIGVTLSYVYNLLDPEVPFSTRAITLERIAVVMDLEPTTFSEYKASDDPRPLDPGIVFFKKCQAGASLTNVQFLKQFPRKARLPLVDMWRGARPFPLDWVFLDQVAAVLQIPEKDIYPFWQARLQQHLKAGGVDTDANVGLIDAMFEGVRHYLKLS